MKKIYYLKTCSTCQRIIKELEGLKGFQFQNIGVKNISPDELDELALKAGSYEALFSRRAMKYKSLGLNKMELSEKAIREYILEEYTFLKRPVIIHGDDLFIGNAPSVIRAAYDKILG
jgi:arsenate reductase